MFHLLGGTKRAVSLEEPHSVHDLSARMSWDELG